MGKLGDALNEYKRAPIGSPAEREAADIIKGIVESEWWDINVGKEFKWPKKYKKTKQFGYTEETGFVTVGHWIIPKWDYDEQIALLTKPKKNS